MRSVVIGVVLAAGVARADSPKELADLGKAIGNGTWSCTGNALTKTMTATRTSKFDMNGVWMHDSVEAKLGDAPFHFEVYTSYDPNGKHFHRVMLESDGGIGEGEGHLAGSAVEFNLDTHGNTRGDGLFRERIDWSDSKAGVKASGEISSDKGKTWIKIYELTCKRN